jgi:hypothetical protein
MLIRIGGGKEGIKEYLEKGHKQGREFSRDELDERVILAGDLDFTDQLINDMETDAERYLHITLAFKEDEISQATMEAIVQDFERFVFAAYGKDEYNYYAEAHLPKIKSYVNAKTGETVERKPHIHFVIPKTNLLSGDSLNPLGMVKHNEQFIDAFQEHINNRYGLASPKNNRRIEFTDASDMIQRYKDDEFSGSSKELKQEILSAILERNITSYEQFKELLAEYGDTRTRNSGREGEYQNVKPEAYAKGVNLKEYAFSRSFIELSAEEKRAAMETVISRNYEIAGTVRTDTATISAALEEWHSLRAFEVKYINSGHARLYARYKEADVGGKRQILHEQAAKFYANHKEPHHESEGFNRNPFEQVYGFKQPEQGLDRGGPGYDGPGLAERSSGPKRAHDGGNDGPIRGGSPGEPGSGSSGTYSGGAAAGRWQSQDQAQSIGQEQGGEEQRELIRLKLAFAADSSHDPRTHTGVASARSANGLRTLSGVDVVGFGERSEVLLPHHAPIQLVHQRRDSTHGLRRHSDSQRGSGQIRATGRITDSKLSQYGRDLRERGQLDAITEIEEFRQIRLQLDAHRLLIELSQSHGVIMDKYEVVKAADGSARIVCGTRKLNVSDFLTREMRLSWGEASEILRDSYARQQDMLPVQAPRVAPSSVLWRQFQYERKKRGTQRELWTRQFASEKARRDALKRDREMKRMAGPKTPMQRKAHESVASMAYMAAEQALNAEIRIERQKLRTPISDQYREFLRELAEAGNSAALIELRRMVKHPPSPVPAKGGAITAAGERPEENGIFYRGRDVRFRVHLNGDVVYSLGGRAIIEDRGSKLLLLQTDRFAIEAGLRLAQAKYGSVITVTGSKEFQEHAAVIAAQAGIKITFEDKSLEALRQQKAADLASKRAEKSYHQKLGREFEPRTATQGTTPTPKTKPVQNISTPEPSSKGKDQNKEPGREQ